MIRYVVGCKVFCYFFLFKLGWYIESGHGGTAFCTLAQVDIQVSFFFMGEQ